MTRAIPADRDQEALLTKVLLARGFGLVAPLEWTEIAEVPAARVAGGAVLATFTRSLTLEQFEALVAEEPAAHPPRGRVTPIELLLL